MKIHEINQKTDIEQNVKLQAAYVQIEKLLSELHKRDLPDEVAVAINQEIEAINTSSFSAGDLRKTIKNKQTKILKLLEKEVKLVPINYYRNLWFGFGMAILGLPLGVVFGLSLGNMAYLGIGLPIGMVIGMAIGEGMDKKAIEEGRQLDIKIS